MQKHLLIFLLALVYSPIQAQDLPFTGFVHNPDSAAIVPLDSFFLNDGVRIISSAATVMKQYPTPRNQGEIDSCVPWAVIHTWLIQYYYKNEIESTLAQIDSIQLSASYLYNQILQAPGDCYSGSLIPSALRVARDRGICPASLFSNSRQKCAPYPKPEHHQAAQLFRIYCFYNALDGKVEKKERLASVKKRISMHIPVIVGLSTSPNFANIRDGDEWWFPDQKTKPSNLGHAFVAVAYDDNDNGGSITLMGSFGAGWGRDGFIKMRYVDFQELLLEAYTLYFSESCPK